jgi:hypothetical protein
MGATMDCLPPLPTWNNDAAVGDAGGDGGNADPGTSSVVLMASNAPEHDYDANDDNTANNDATGKKTLVSAVAGGLVALDMIALLAAFVYGRRHHHGGKDDDGGGGEDLVKAVPVLTLVNNNVENLCDGGGNDDGNAYHKLYYGAAGGGAVSGVIGGSVSG